ncbi:gallate decarboxylase subunit D [Desulfarculales bacterium]
MPDYEHMPGPGSLQTQAPGFNLRAQWLTAGPDLLVLVTGGDSPHIGAVAAATPRPSLADSRRTSATASVLCFVGHKEDDLAKGLAEYLAASLGVRVVVAAGAHWDGLQPAQIEAVRHNARHLSEMLLEVLDQEA